MWKEFKAFIVRGNMIDMAIAFTVGAAFTALVKSLVDHIIMPPIAFLIGKVSFTDRFAVLRQGMPTGPYGTLQAATDAGAVTLPRAEAEDTISDPIRETVKTPMATTGMSKSRCVPHSWMSSVWGLISNS